MIGRLIIAGVAGLMPAVGEADAPAPPPAVDDGPCPTGTLDPLAVWPTAWFEDGRWFVPPLVVVAVAESEDQCATPAPPAGPAAPRPSTPAAQLPQTR